MTANTNHANEPPAYTQIVVPMTFDVAEAQRRREAYEDYRRDYTRLWRECEADAAVLRP